RRRRRPGRRLSEAATGWQGLKEASARPITINSEGTADTDQVLTGLSASAAWHFVPGAETRYGMTNVLATSARGVLAGHAGPVRAVAFSRTAPRSPPAAATRSSSCG
ncbi:hypothetical protein ACFQ08_13630, partial [Streptosporangium algeriense]